MRDTQKVLLDTFIERHRQDTKHGFADHCDGTGGDRRSALADDARRDCQQAFASGEGTWRHILTEEVAEALAGDDPSRLSAELTQVAAVATAWIEALRAHNPQAPERVYLSGPISGVADAVRSFSDAAQAATAAGVSPLNPFDVPPHDHGDIPCPPDGYSPGAQDARHTSSCCFLRTDLFALLACDGIWLLPGWERSRGAGVEITVAQSIGLPICELVDDQAVSISYQDIDTRLERMRQGRIVDRLRSISISRAAVELELPQCHKHQCSCSGRTSDQLVQLIADHLIEQALRTDL